ncbi:MAG: accessory factor UbiK family protein [Cardiobacteriaceae bacterium]|nr:accessory factor UbiK family protein [Cardiobacteriaceae bacterium]
MLSRNPFDFLRDQLEQHTPSALRPLAHDAKQQAQRLFQKNFLSQDFVSREQYATQQALLEEALKRIEALEAELAKQSALSQS